MLANFIGHNLKLLTSYRDSRVTGWCHGFSGMPINERVSAGKWPRRCLQLLDRARPVGTQQTRQTAVGQDPPARLAAWAVVGLVFRVSDALDRGAAGRAGLPEAAMDRHPGPKRGDPLRKGRCGVVPTVAGSTGPAPRMALEQPRQLGLGELAAHRQRREPRGMQDLVRVGVADPAKSRGSVRARLRV